MRRKRLSTPAIKWSKKEDQKLRQAVLKYGTQWSVITKKYRFQRSINSLVKRWHGKLKQQPDNLNHSSQNQSQSNQESKKQINNKTKKINKQIKRPISRISRSRVKNNQQQEKRQRQIKNQKQRAKRQSQKKMKQLQKQRQILRESFQEKLKRQQKQRQLRRKQRQKERQKQLSKDKKSQKRQQKDNKRGQKQKQKKQQKIKIQQKQKKQQKRQINIERQRSRQKEILYRQLLKQKKSPLNMTQKQKAQRLQKLNRLQKILIGETYQSQQRQRIKEQAYLKTRKQKINAGNASSQLSLHSGEEQDQDLDNESSHLIESYECEHQWQQSEDNMLKYLITNEMILNWQQIAARLKITPERQVKKRWQKHIYPSIVESRKIGGCVKYSQEEDAILNRGVKLGLTISQLRSFLPNRTFYSLDARRRRTLRIQQQEIPELRYWVKKMNAYKFVQKRHQHLEKPVSQLSFLYRSDSQ